MGRVKYNFSKKSDAVPMSVYLSKDLTDRMDVICNLIEMTRSALCRYILKRGIGDLEDKLAERVAKMKAADEVANS